MNPPPRKFALKKLLISLLVLNTWRNVAGGGSQVDTLTVLYLYNIHCNSMSRSLSFHNCSQLIVHKICIFPVTTFLLVWTTFLLILPALMRGDAVLLYLLIQCANPLNQIYVVADVTSVHRAKRHQSTLRLARGKDAPPSRVTEDYCRNDHLRFILFWGLNILALWSR